jgi:hypothetical protein
MLDTLVDIEPFDIVTLRPFFSVGWQLRFLVQFIQPGKVVVPGVGFAPARVDDTAGYFQNDDYGRGYQNARRQQEEKPPGNGHRELRDIAGADVWGVLRERVYLKCVGEREDIEEDEAQRDRFRQNDDDD